MLVKELKELRRDGFPDAFYDSLPEICPEEGCGFPTEMLDTLTHLHCSNPRCPAKIEQRIISICSTLGVKDFGEARVRAFIRAWGVTNPLILFAYEPDEDGLLADNMNMDMCKRIYAQINAKRNFTLSEYVRIANLPNVQTSSNSIFDNFDDLGEAYRAIESGGIPYIQKCLGVGEGASIRALKVYESLMTYKFDLFEFIDTVNIIKKNDGDIVYYKACVSGDVGFGYATKAEFYEYVNSLSPRLHVDFLGSVRSDINYLIWAGDRFTNKVKKVNSMNEKGSNIPILNAEEFVNEMKRQMEE